MEWQLLAIVVIGITSIFILLNKKLSDIAEKQGPSGELLEIVKMLQTASSEERVLLVETLRKNTESLNQRLDNASNVISQVQKNIGEMSEIGRGVKEFQELLQSPKLRGNIGEQVLKELLGQFLPKHSFHLQYTFKNGEKVDAAIRTSAGIIPVDSKFPMENFRKLMAARTDNEKKLYQKQFERDVKLHIEAISKKYILTDEGTIDYALMYVPSEAVYYEIVNNNKIFDYAADKRVLPVSPTTFYAYLRVILMSFEGQKIEKEAGKMFALIRAMQKDYEKTQESMLILQKHLTNAGSMMGNMVENFTHLGQKLKLTSHMKKLPEKISETQQSSNL